MNILNWTAEVDEVWNDDKTSFDYGIQHFVVIKVNGIEVARNDGKEYVDVYGDGGDDVTNIAVKMIRKAFNAVS